MDIGRLLARQRAFYTGGSAQRLPARLAALRRLEQAVRLREGGLLDALKADLNKSRMEGYMTEVGLVLEELRLLQRQLPRWMAPRTVPAPLAQLPAIGRIYPKPYGQVLVLSPWNYPVQLSLIPLAGAIAAGNTVILKPSEQAPATAAVLAAVLRDAFPPEQAAVVQGGRETGEELLRQRFDKIFFTGSPAAGRAVMAAAAKHLTPVTLELGGKSPCIVDETADIPLAARRIIFGKLLNSGQTCVAPDYVLVQEDKKEALTREMIRAIGVSFGPRPLQNPDLPRIVNRRRLDRLLQLLQGQTVLYGGGYREGALLLEPTLVDSPDPSSPLMTEEIFGPILPILPYRELREAVAFVNSREKPLALYLFSRDRARQQAMLRATASGGACINDTVVQLSVPALPFGGVGESGMGAYHGKASFDAFTHYRSVLYRGLGPELPVRYPPYTGKKLALIRKLIK